ncbi:MAG: stage II sporulation protein M [Planctomycetes bacterium]|nr:stage II sporulation protein M [Planctomycetota bacterium]
MISGELRSLAFRRERERNWRELEGILTRIERAGLAALSERELARLPVLHRAAMSALSVARSVSLDRNLLEYLESLTMRSYVRLYGNRRRLGSTVREFFSMRFPAVVREARWAVFLSIALMLVGVCVGFAATVGDLERYYSFVSADMAQGRDPTASYDELRDVLFDEFGAEGALTTFATFLFTHNTQVGILCFALGFAVGVPVIYLLLMNGMLLGAMSALYHVRGLSPEFWSWILPHGVTELLAICLCGAAGLFQGYAVVFPGRATRISNLAIAGRKAGVIVIGCVALFMIAALVEGFLRQLVHSLPIRYGLAGASLLFWIVYFHRVGRPTHDRA